MNEWFTKENAQLFGLVLGSLIAGLFGKSWLTRRVSKDGVVVATDAGEKRLIASLTADIQRREDERITDYARWAAERRDLIDRADKINAERNAAVEQIGALRQQVHDLTTKVLDLSGHVERLERISAAHKEVNEGLQRQLTGFMNIHVFGGNKPKPE